MDFEYCLGFLASSLAAFCCIGICSAPTCESPQYMNYGEIGTINCIFHDDFFSVLWFDTKYDRQSKPILHYQDFTKSGAGYDSGEFDIHSNGSLIITNVSLEHETTFTALYVHSRTEDVVFFSILVVVIVKPKEEFPRINYCPSTSQCFAEVGSTSVNCSVGSARPSIALTWVARTVEGDRNITTDMSIKSEGLGYTSRATTGDVSQGLSRLVLLVCKASDFRGILQSNESLLLAQNQNVTLSTTEKRSRYIERYTKMRLGCTAGDIGFVVWKKVRFDEKNAKTEHEMLLYSIFLGGEWSEVFANGFNLGTNASLVVPVVDIRHEGLYYCIYGDGLKDELVVYDVTVKVEPVPSYPVVEGCDRHQYCVLKSNYDGSLTCKLKGIRPRVQLQWNTFLGSDTLAILFTNQHLTIQERGETFDVTLTSTYHVMDMSRDRLTIECKVPDTSEKLFYLTTKIDLLFEKDDVDPTDIASETPVSNGLTWIIPIVVVPLLLFLILCLGVVYRKYWKDKTIKSQKKPEQPGEVWGMLSSMDHQNQALTANNFKQQFLKQIKERYKDLYDAVQPIPYIKDRLYCVDKVFVEGGIEFLDSTTSDRRIRGWKRLETFQDIFHDPRVKSTRRILEGEPGYGKSTVTLQFAYEWCNNIQGSALKDVEILILLRLRQLGGVSSVYRAIKQFILPKDTTLTEGDIENIFRKCTSIVVILDGFDEYPDQESIPTTDVINIIARQMFQEYEVVTTTRSSFLPKKYPPLTKRVRLTGFDDNSRRYYIRKAVVGEDEERVREIEQYLEENPILRDLCQVPLLFVIFAHMTYESEKFRNLNSVTSFFRYMISCFHSHMRNKMEEENVRKYELFETDHRELDRVAFEAFSGNTQKIVWEKEVLCKQIGQEFYDQYVRIGILVEEEVIDIIDDPGTLITEHVQYKTEVRFYHKLFCEWYAAHYISDYLQQNPNVDLSTFLQHLDPFDVQYMYRFSCGLNSDSAEKIISYLKNIEGGDKFAILCILEQTGKVDHIKETIRQLCDEGVLISGYDSLLLQRSSMQILELAAKNDIPIEYVSLHNCLQSVDLSTSAIRTTSGLTLTSRIPVKALAVYLSNRDMTEDEAIDILQVASMCPSLRSLTYADCVPPRSFNVGPTLSTLKSRNVTGK
ncbi:NLR family CARD domain-containing protein 4 [Holothuria leucospilota]|uniref:NLR family CARD domain-containing protein 4 n=1 Tax=Holothuria leucospilota TaxID=206669 RepID=A0A9Q0YCL9_HOLLE|nr:NLR family CARD domain-containing protein 4 [Holothuria leucospilota]